MLRISTNFFTTNALIVIYSRYVMTLTWTMEWFHYHFEDKTKHSPKRIDALFRFEKHYKSTWRYHIKRILFISALYKSGDSCFFSISLSLPIFICVHHQHLALKHNSFQIILLSLHHLTKYLVASSFSSFSLSKGPKLPSILCHLFLFYNNLNVKLL